MAEGGLPALTPSRDRPSAPLHDGLFSPGGGSRMPGAGAAEGGEGEAGRLFPMAVLCLVRSRGLELPASFILNVRSICVA